MGHLTRAKAAGLADQMHVDESTHLDIPSYLTHSLDRSAAPEPEARTPLADIEPNSGGSTHDEEAEMDLKKSTRSRKAVKKGGKTGAKKNTNNAQREGMASTSKEPAGVQPVEHDSVPSPASKAAPDYLMKDDPRERVYQAVELSHLPVHDTRPNSPPSQAVRTAPEAVTETVSGTMPSTRQRANSPVRLSTPSGNKHAPASTDQHKDMASDAVGLDTSTYDKLEAAVVEGQATPPRSSSKATDNDPIMALDALDDAVDEVNAEVPQVPASPDKPKPKKAPIVRTTKASQARISLAHGPKDPQRRISSWGKPKPPASLTQSTIQRATSVSGNKNTQTFEKKEAEIPHSKPRPISMSFPTPPPPPKSTKAPTKSTFQLPGEAIAAKLKAAREARLQTEAEDQKKKTFKARPAPAATKTPAVRQTSTSKAREFMMNGKPTADVLKRANSVATTRPSISGKPNGIKTAAASTAKPISNRMSIVPAQSIKASKRPSTAMAAMSKPRPSTALNRAAPPSVTAVRPASTIGQVKGNGTTKGKAVFNRAAEAKSTAQREQREKEEAAKKARAEAAERGRQLSREWAEKQRLKKLRIKPETGLTENISPVDEVAIAPSETSN